MAPPTETSGQAKILAAIKLLSDRMDAAGIVTAAATETQDKLAGAQVQVRIDPILARLDSIDVSVKGIKDEVGGVKDQLTILNGTVHTHNTDIKVLKVFCDDQVKPALKQLVDLRIEFGKWVAGGAGLGAILLAGIAIFRALGWM